MGLPFRCGAVALAAVPHAHAVGLAEEVLEHGGVLEAAFPRDVDELAGGQRQLPADGREPRADERGVDGLGVELREAQLQQAARAVARTMYARRIDGGGGVLLYRCGNKIH